MSAERLARRLLIGAIHLYRGALSAWMGPACRFEPSCSAYAVEAIEVHGVARGVGLAVRRVARCHPFGGYGLDPIPPVAERKADGP